MKKKINLILACSDLGVNIDGSNLGPEILVKSLNTDNINDIKIIKKDEEYKKDKSKNNKKKNLDEINKINNKIYNAVKDSLDTDCFPITIGGDHSVAIGSSLASVEKYCDMGIIWFDSHGDYHTLDTTMTGNIHGLPFAVVTGYEKRMLSEFQNKKYFNYKNAVLFGARDIDKPDELNNLKVAGVTIITTDDIEKYGIVEMCKKAFEIASNGTKGIHISYDIDCIDPDVAPGVSVPVKDGLNLSDAYYFIDYMIKNIEMVKSFDLVEFNPLRDKDDVTKEIALEVLNKIIENI